MGGGNVTRLGFERPRPDPNDPCTEFYLLLQAALLRRPVLALPGAWISFRPPADQKLYAEDMPACCRVDSQPRPDNRPVFDPGRLRVAYADLAVRQDGCPTALLLKSEEGPDTLALQLAPPLAGPGWQLPPLPDCAQALRLQLTFDDLDAADRDPEALGDRLRDQTRQKQWLRHPKIDRWMEKALSVAQKDYNKKHRPPASYY